MRRSRLLMGTCLLSLVAITAGAQDQTGARLTRALLAAGVPVVSVTVEDTANKATWTVQPASLQAAAQPIIDAFNLTNPAHATADLDREARAIPRHVRAQVLYYLRDQLQRNPTAAERQAAIDALILAYKDVGP